MKTSNIQHSTSREHPTTNHQTNERHPTSTRHWNLKFGASLVLGAWCLALPLCGTVFAQGTAFTYQGRLNSSGAPASGTYNLTFSLFNVNSGGVPVAGPVTNNAVAVSNGLFTVLIDFGSAVFTGANYWLQIGVESNGISSFTTLTPRQQLTPAPYAIFAEGADAAGISGTLPTANLGGIYSGTVNFNNGADSFDGSFYGAFYGTSFIGGNFTGDFIGNGSGLSGVWLTDGNSGTTTGANFVGTKDNQPLELHVNGIRALRLEPTATNGAVNVIGGSPNNYVVPGIVGATIGGGGALNYSGAAYSNSVTFNFGTVGGGYANLANGYAAVVAGGYQNANNGFVAFLGAGDANTIVGNGGGDGAFLGGGYGNTNGGSAATIVGGGANFIGGTANNAFIGGGGNNSIVGSYALPVFGTISGGYLNTIQTNVAYATIGGGVGNVIQPNAHDSTLGGGSNNVIQSGAVLAAIGGGASNSVGGAGGFIGGGGFDGSTFLGNYAGPASVVGGGIGNSASFLYSSIGGGQQNKATYEWDTVSGGQQNTAGSGGWDTVGGGIYNTASGLQATVCGGANNVASGTAAFIGGGGDNGVTLSGNQAGGTVSVVTGGSGNSASGFAATVPGGTGNSASGGWSFAAGDGAQAVHQGAFVWADSQGASYSSDLNNQFKIRAGGGVVMDVSGSSGLNPAALRVNSTSGNGVGLFVSQTSSDATAVFTAAGAGDIIKGFSGSGGGNLAFEVVNNGTVYTQGLALTSDRNAKEHFAAVNPAEILDKVAALTISEWNYIMDPAGQKHLGPVAQDFHAAFGLNGSDDKHISVVDENGVALAAIQGLNQKLNEKDSEIQKLKQQNETLEKRLDNLEQMIKSTKETK